MPTPSLLLSDTRLNVGNFGGITDSRVIARSDGGALVIFNVLTSTTPVHGRLISPTGVAIGTTDLVFPNVSFFEMPTVSARYDVADLVGGGFVIASRVGDSVRVERFSAIGGSLGAVTLTSSAPLTGGPTIETTADGTIGVYLKTASSAQVGAFDAALNVLVPFQALTLNNGTADSITETNGQPYTIIDGAGIGSAGFALATTQGSGAGTVVQLHIVSIATLSDTTGPITVAGGSTLVVSSFQLAETASGNFVASWIDGSTVNAQIYSAAGLPIGAAMHVQATAPNGASASIQADGGVTLVWSDVNGNQSDVMAASFTGLGVPTGAAVTVNSITAGNQSVPSAVLLGSGDVFAAWIDAASGQRDSYGRVLSYTKPDARPDSYDAVAGVAAQLAVTANDSDPNGDTLSVTAVGTALHGTVTRTGNIVNYTPTASYVGADTFTYTLTDGSTRSDTGTVTLNVRAAAVAPTLLGIDPAPAGTGASVVSNVALSFAANVTRGAGVVTLSTADGSVVEAFDVASSSRISVTGNRVTIDPSAPLAAGTAYSVSVSSGAFSVGGGSYAGLSGYSFTTAAAATTADQFVDVATAGVAASVAGYGQMIGDSGVQDVTVLDRPGRIVFDGSFNQGGDRIRLSGNAANYTVVRNGSAVQISDGDTTIAVPVGLSGADVIFADGLRTLSFDTSVGLLRIGAQAIGATPALISAAAGTATATGAVVAGASSTLALLAGGSAAAVGTVQVVGTSGAETVSVAAGAKAIFDGSFNQGGDTIILPGNASGWSAARSGSSVVLTSATESVTIPVGPAATTLRFGDGDRALLFDTAAAAVKVGAQAIGTTGTGLTAAVPPTILSLDRDSDANVATPITVSAAGGDYRLTDEGNVAHNARITGFGRGDTLVMTGATTDYAFSGSNGDIFITHLVNGVLATTTLVGIADPQAPITNEASAELAAGFDFASFTV